MVESPSSETVTGTGAIAHATLGLGCFWCAEAVFVRLEGVLSVRPGYAGGHTEHPTYKEVCSDATGHAEVVRIAYESSRVSFGVLLDLFFRAHDPTEGDRQGMDIGSQYRSIILAEDASQLAEAKARVAAENACGRWPDPLTTEVVMLEHFFEAEPEHHNYYANHPEQGYCRMVITPKLWKLAKGV